MHFKNIKAADMEGRVDLPGLSDWVGELGGDTAALLITAPAGTGKTAAVGAIARKLDRDVMQCDMLQVFEYPDAAGALRSILTIAENLRSVLFQADGIDRMVERFGEVGEAGVLAEMSEWLASRKDALRGHGVVLVATGRDAAALPEGLRALFDKTFAAA